MPGQEIGANHEAQTIRTESGDTEVAAACLLSEHAETFRGLGRFVPTDAPTARSEKHRRGPTIAVAWVRCPAPESNARRARRWFRLCVSVRSTYRRRRPSRHRDPQ